MIHLQGVNKRYGTQLLFESVSWTIHAGERYALVGPNGAGKTTLCRMIMGTETLDGGEIARPKELTVGYLQQEVDPSQGVTILERCLSAFGPILELEKEARALQLQISDASLSDADQAKCLERLGDVQVRLEQSGAFDLEARAKRILGGLGFKDEDHNQMAQSLSGGWMMRVELARLLLMAPDVLLLDEPTNHLDIPSLEWFEGFLQSFEGTLIIVSHDRFFMNRVCNRVAEVFNCDVRVYTGNYDSYLLQRAEARDLLARQAKNQAKKIQEVERYIERFRYKQSKAKGVQSRIKALAKVERLEEEGDNSGLSTFDFPKPPRSGRMVMELKGVQKSYGETTVYSDLNFDIERGQRVALVGPNGAGKSTLLKILANDVKIDGGEAIEGHNVMTQYFAQHQVAALRADMTVLEELSADAGNETQTRLRGILGAFLFSGDAVEKKVGVLSGGEKSRLSLAKMLLKSSNFLLLDEPTNHLDVLAREELMGALSRYEGTLCFISHDRHFINGVATHVVDVNRGSLIRYEGDFDYYLWKRGRMGQEMESIQGHQNLGDGRTLQKEDAAGAPSKSLSRKEQKRLEAQVRADFAPRLRHKRKDCSRMEKDIAEVEARLGEIETLQEDPNFFGDGENVQAIYVEQGKLNAKLDGLMNSWEESGEALEAIEGELEVALGVLRRN